MVSYAKETPPSSNAVLLKILGVFARSRQFIIRFFDAAGNGYSEIYTIYVRKSLFYMWEKGVLVVFLQNSAKKSVYDTSPEGLHSAGVPLSTSRILMLTSVNCPMELEAIHSSCLHKIFITFITRAC